MHRAEDDEPRAGWPSAPAARRCANGHPLPPGYQLCSACGAFAAAPESAPPTAVAPTSNAWVYVSCGLSVLAALVVVGLLVLRTPSPSASSATAAPKAAPGSSARPSPTTSRPRATSSSTTTAPSSRGGAFEITPERLKAELKAQGMAPDQADCIVDGLVEEGIDLSTFAAPTDEQQRVLVEIASRCAAGG